MGCSSHILQFFGRLVECRQPWTNHLFMFIGRIYKPISFLHDPSRRDKSWIAAVFSGVFCLYCFVFSFISQPMLCFLHHYVFFWVALLTEISGTCAIKPKLTSRVFLKDVILAFQSPLGWIVSQHTPLTYHPQKQWFNKALLSETN